jgi:hypothetical protein
MVSDRLTGARNPARLPTTIRSRRSRYAPRIDTNGELEPEIILAPAGPERAGLRSSAVSLDLRVDAEPVGSDANRSAAPVAAQHESGDLQGYGVRLGVADGPLDDHLDMRSYRQRFTGPKAQAACAHLPGDAGAPAGRSALLRDPEVDRQMKFVTICGAPIARALFHADLRRPLPEVLQRSRVYRKGCCDQPV